MQISTKHYMVSTTGPWWSVFGRGATLKLRSPRTTVFRRFYTPDLYLDIQDAIDLPYPEEIKYILEKLAYHLTI